MPVRVELYDWNGTVDRARHENVYLRYVISELLKEFGSAIAGVQLAGDRPQLSLSITISPKVSIDRLRTTVEALVPSYPVGRKEGIDHQMIKRARAARKRGIVTGILSASWSDLITTILQNNGYLERPKKPDAFDFVIANDVVYPERPGDRLEFRQRIYGNKGVIIRDLFECMKPDFKAFDFLMRSYKREGILICGDLSRLSGIDISEAAYVGDTFDDESAMDVVGYPTLSPRADPEFADHARRKYENLTTNYRRLADHWASR